MEFLFPGFLWALVLLALPVIIHLFYFRRYKKVLFTNVRFLKELVEETSSKNKLKNILILLSRLLALAALIFAFAQPFKKSDQKISQASRAVSIFVDNSWSMTANDDETSLVQKAKKRAVEIINAYSDIDKFQILTNELSGKQLRLVSKKEAYELIEEIKAGPEFQSLSHIVQRQIQTIQQTGFTNGNVYLLSDFQKNSCDVDATKLDSNFALNLVPVQSIQENNLSLDTAAFISPVIIPQQVNQLVYSVTNYGSSDVNDIRVSYMLNGQEFPAASLNVAAGKTKWDTLKISIPDAGWQNIVVKINDYPIQFDDQFNLAFKVADEIKVLVIYEQELPANLSKLVSSLPYFKVDYSTIGQINYSKLSAYKLIILSEINQISTGLASGLKQCSKDGCNLVIIPAADLSPNSMDAMKATLDLPNFISFDKNTKECNRLNFEEEIYHDVFANQKANIKLPTTKGQYQFDGIKSFEPIIFYKDGSSFIRKYTIENSVAYLFASPLSESYADFLKNPEIAIPFFFKSALAGVRKQALSYIIGQDKVIEWPYQTSGAGEDLVLKLNGPEEFLPGIKSGMNSLQIEIFDQLHKSGIYKLESKEKFWGNLAFNDNRMESNPAIFTMVELEERYAGVATIYNQKGDLDFTSVIKSQNESSNWWKYLLILALLGMIIESLLIRFWK